MFPPVGVGQIRVSHTHDLVLCNGKLTVPRSTLIWVPHHSMHNTTHNWDEPEKFLPGGRSLPVGHIKLGSSANDAGLATQGTPQTCL